MSRPRKSAAEAMHRLALARHEERPLETLIAIRRESWQYTCRKPGRVPAADSPNRPALAWLWLAGHLAVLKRKNLRAFRFAGAKFGVVYVGQRLCIFDWASRRALVRSPTSREALEAVIGCAVHGDLD